MKYETMFTREEPADWGVLRHFNTPLRKDKFYRLDDAVFWHSLVNDGSDELSHWPFYREYEAF